MLRMTVVDQARGMVSVDGFRKRDGSIVAFQREKIELAVRRAAEEVERKQGLSFAPELPGRIADLVISQLSNPRSEYGLSPDERGRHIANIEDVQDLVEVALAEEGFAAIVASYKRYRKLRKQARERIRVRDLSQKGKVKDLTDASLLLVESVSGNSSMPWERTRIVKHLLNNTSIPPQIAVSVAKAVENAIIDSELQTINTKLIRELVNNELAERGWHEELRDLSVYGVPREFIETMMFSKSTENSNIVNNNPEAVNLGIAELVLKQWALDTIFSPEVKKAHDTGAVHLHDLGYPHRVYCSSHSVEYIKKYGLQGLINLNTESKPARSASVLTGHLNTFLASMQANYAGALGIAYINILYGPYLVGMSHVELKQVAQELIFNGSQNAFSRGGQTIFLDFNIHSGVPSYLKAVPAVGPGGHYMLRRKDGSIVELIERQQDEKDPNGNALMELLVAEEDGKRVVLREVMDARKEMIYDPEVVKDLARRGESIVTYGDFEKEAREFAVALLEVWGEGDKNGRVFEFPKCDFHINEETFSDPEQYKIFEKACELASKNGSTYFIFDRDAVTLSACCRLRTTINDTRMLKHPESLRFCGFQNVTINIPQAAYRAARANDRTLDGLFAEIDKTMDLAVQAHLQKRAKVKEMMSGPGHPLWQIGKPSCDGRPYVELDKCTYIIGLIGVNDAVRFLTGEQLHESEAAEEMGLRIVAHMFLRIREYSEQYGLKFALEESPAESAARRLARADLVFYHEEASEVVKGDSEDVAYYTNSIHLPPEADVSLVERIRKQSMYHGMIEAGAITHAFIGEEQPSAAAIGHLIRESFFRTQAAQITISPEFSYCDSCGHNMRGLQDACLKCGSERVVHETRVVGYFSKIENWNKSKRFGELVDRHRGDYSVTTAETIAGARA